MIKNSCFECGHFEYNRCQQFGYYFKDFVAKKTTCKKHKEKEQLIQIGDVDDLEDTYREGIEQ
jgi:hypothetical protein